MSSRVLALSVVAFGAAALLPAQTFAGAPPTDRPLTTTRVMDSLAIAADFWDAWPDCAVRVYLATPAQLAASTGRAAAAATMLGVQPDSAECAIWLSDELAGNSVENRIWVCTDLAHEVGHRLGYPDETAGLSLMNGFSDSILYGCYRRFLPRGYGVWWRENVGDPVWAARPS